MAIVDKTGALHGSISNLVYRTYRKKQIVQIKPARVKQTLSSKEASMEFGISCSTARVIRNAFGYVYKGYDGGMINRLNSAVRKSISASAKARGERDIHDAELSYLKGFQFNANSPLDRVFKGRPDAEINIESKMVVNLPAITVADIKSPGCAHYVIRLIAIAFDFKKQVYSYVASKEIVISHEQPLAAGPILFDEVLPAGRLVCLSMSVHAYKIDGFGGMETLNSVNWSPAELVGAWQVPAEHEEVQRVIEEASSKPAKNFRISHAGNILLTKIWKLREKAGPAKKPTEKERSADKSPAPGELPKGGEVLNLRALREGLKRKTRSEGSDCGRYEDLQRKA